MGCYSSTPAMAATTFDSRQVDGPRTRSSVYRHALQIVGCFRFLQHSYMEVLSQYECFILGRDWMVANSHEYNDGIMVRSGDGLSPLRLALSCKLFTTECFFCKGLCLDVDSSLHCSRVMFRISRCFICSSGFDQTLTLETNIIRVIVRLSYRRGFYFFE